MAANVFTLSLTAEERTELLKLLDQSLIDTHAEKRRTENPNMQVEVGHEEVLPRTLRDKVRQLKA